jgi:hypothetical protein
MDSEPRKKRNCNARPEGPKTVPLQPLRDRHLTGTEVPKNVNNKWTPDADDQLRSLIQSNTSIHFVAAEMKRSAPALKGRRISCI